VASIKFNPFTGKFDYVGSGGGASYIDGEVEFHGDLPTSLGVPAIDSAFLVRKGSGLYFISRKPAGIWVRELNNGNLDDWKYAGTFSDLYRDTNFRIINDADTSKEIAFSAAAITSGQTRTVTVPDASGTLVYDTDARLSDSRTPTSHASSHAAAGSDPVFDQDLNTTDSVQFESLTIDSQITASGSADFSGLSTIQLPPVVSPLAIYEAGNLYEGGFRAEPDSLTANRTYDLPDASGTLALTSDIPDPSAATPQALGSASAGSSDDYSRGDHIHAAPALNDLSNVSAATPSDNDVLTFDTATSTWVAEAPAASGIAETLLDAKGDLIVASAADTAARLAVGTNGHVLTVDSAETLGVKWAAAAASNMTGATASTAGTAGLVPQPAAGENLSFLAGNATYRSKYPSLGVGGAGVYYDGGGTDTETYAGTVPFFASAASNNRGATAARISWIPFHIDTAKTFTACLYRVSANENANGAKIAFYSADPATGMPKDRIGAVETASVATAAAITTTFSAAKTIPAGWFWVGVVASSITNFFTVNVATRLLVPLVWGDGVAVNSGLFDLQNTYANAFPSSITINSDIRLNTGTSLLSGECIFVVLRE